MAERRVSDDAVERAALTHARAFVPDVQEVINDDAGDDPDPQWVYDRLIESLAVIDSLVAAFGGEYAGAEHATQVGMIAARAALAAAGAGEAVSPCYCGRRRDEPSPGCIYHRARADRAGEAAFRYAVTSDVPLTLANGIGNVPVLTPSGAYGRRIDREGYSVTAGPQAAPATITARLVEDEPGLR